MIKYSRILLIFLLGMTISTTICYSQIIDFEKFKKDDVVDKKYSGFGLGEWQNEDEKACYVKFIGNISGYQLIGFCRNLEATLVFYPENINIFLLKNGKIIDKIDTLYNRESDVDFKILHDTFITYIETKHKWFEDEFQNMKYVIKEDYTGGLCFVIKEDKIISMDDLSAKDLRIYRNLIFAKYGYVFKSEDLNKLFKATKWYKPNPELKGEDFLIPEDKQLVEYIRYLELNTVHR